MVFLCLGRFTLFLFEVGIGYVYPLAKTLSMITKGPKEFT